MTAFLPAPVAGTAVVGPRMLRLQPWEVLPGDRLVHNDGRIVTDVVVSRSPIKGVRYTYKAGTTAVTWRESHEWICVFRGVDPTPAVDTDGTPPWGIDRPRHLHLVGGA